MGVKEVLSSVNGAHELEPITSIFTMDLASPADYVRLKDYVGLREDEQVLAYLSVPPGAAGQIIHLMGEAGLNGPGVKLLLEKPFGTDLNSAIEMVGRLNRYFDEEQIYRIDHYLAKEMAQNIVVFRARNAIFSHLWNNQAIEKIEIEALEEIGVENRAQFYEQTGALRDVMQSHVLQLLSLVLMEAPKDLDWNELSERRLTALRQVKSAEPSLALRAQYAGYQDEAGSPYSRTETFVSMELMSDAPRWRGVPLVLTHGKALDKKLTEIRVFFRKSDEAQSNCLVFRIQPHEEIEIKLLIKKPGYERTLEEKGLIFTYPGDKRLPEGYEHVLLEAAKSKKSLFPSSQEILESWRIVQPLLETWSFNSDSLPQYQRGSSLSEVLSGVELTAKP